MNEKINYKLLNLLILVSLLSVGVYTLTYIHLFDFIKNILLALIPFYIGFFISWVLAPVAEFIEMNFKINRKIANFIAIFLSIIVILFIFLVIIPLGLLQGAMLMKDFPNVWNEFIKNLSSIIVIPHIKNSNGELYKLILEKVNQIGITNIVNSIKNSLFVLGNGILVVIDSFKNVLGFITQIVFGYIISFYFIGDIRKFVKTITNLFGKDEAKEYQGILVEMSKGLFSYIRGMILVCTVVGIIMTMGTFALGMSSPILFGLISATTNVIPYLGPILGGIPLFIVGLSMGFKTALGVVVLISVVQFVEAYFLQPKIMSKTVNMHPVSIMVSMLIFGEMFGFVGFIISTPILTMINIALKHSRFKDKIHL